MLFGAGFYLGLPYSLPLQMLPITMVSLAVADCIHILVSYFQFKGEGEGPRTALGLYLKKNIIPGILTTVSTMIGFFSFMASDILPLKHFGFLGGIGCLFAWILTIFMVSPALLWFDLKAPKLFRRNPASGSFELAEKLTSWIDRRRGGFCSLPL